MNTESVQYAADLVDLAAQPYKVKLLGQKPPPEKIFASTGKCVHTVPLRTLTGKSILSAEQFPFDTILELYKLAALLQLNEFSVNESITDKVLAAAFFEPSTRTRFSFESAMLRLGGKTMSFAHASSMSAAKGEMLCDIGQMMNSYADVVVIRHTHQESLQEMAEYLRIPMINGGNGSDEHPTQALTDWYAITKWRPELGFSKLSDDEKPHLCIIGSPTQMRSVNSFLRLALKFSHNIKKITIVSELADPLGAYVEEMKRKSDLGIETTNDLDSVMEDIDIFYINSIAFLGDGYRDLEDRYRLSGVSRLKPDSVILHPLARKKELAKDLDSTDHNLYFNQADGAVFVRQALLLSIFDRLGRVIPEPMLV